MEAWIARDRDGELYMFTERPELIKNTYFIAQEDTSSMKMDCDMFPEITIENSPKKVNIKIVEEK